MSYCRLCLFAALIGGMFVRTDAAVRAAEKGMTLSQPVNAHFNTLSTPMTTPAPLFADINNSYQTASICFIGFGECGDNTDFSKSDDGFSLPDCASIGRENHARRPDIPTSSARTTAAILPSAAKTAPKHVPTRVMLQIAAKAKFSTPMRFAPMTDPTATAYATPAAVTTIPMKKPPKKATKSTASPATAAEP